MDEVLSLEQALVENLHREDLNPLEEAAAYQQLIEDFELTQEAVAQKVGRSRSAVANTLRLFQLPPAHPAPASPRTSWRPATPRRCSGTPDRAFQERLAKQIVADGLSVREAEEAVRQHNEAEDAAPESRGGARDGRRRAGRAGACGRRGCSSSRSCWPTHLDTRVRVTMAGADGKGKVVVEFGGLEDLERIYRTMTAEARPA